MTNVFAIIIYIALTVSGLILFKLGTQKGFGLVSQTGALTLNIHLLSVLGIVCYAFSFIFYLSVISRFELSYISPLTTGIVYVLVFVCSALFLKESITVTKIIGTAVIIAGLVILNIPQK